MFSIGPRAHFVAMRLAAQMMTTQRSGLIVNISSPGARAHFFVVPYHAAKAALDKMTADSAVELSPFSVSVVSLWPRLTKTEAVLAEPDRYDFSMAATPQFTGRAVAALVADPAVLTKTGRVLNVIDLAREYGFTDVDGSLPDW